MAADLTTTIAVAKWESDEPGKPGAQRHREWLGSSGIAGKFSPETYDGPVVVAPRTGSVTSFTKMEEAKWITEYTYR